MRPTSGGCVPADAAGAAGEDAGDAVLRDAGSHQPISGSPAAALRVGDLEPRRVVGDVGEREGRVAVGAVGGEGVEAHAPRPAQHAEVEVEDPARVAAAEQQRDERDQREQDERDPEEREDEEVRHDEQPLDQPEPARWLLQMPFESRRKRRGRMRIGRLHVVHSFPSSARWKKPTTRCSYSRGRAWKPPV